MTTESAPDPNGFEAERSPSVLMGAPGEAIRRAMERATGARLTLGNRVSLQFDGPLTFDLWLEAIHKARSFIHFENYILRNDPVGRRFRDALIERAEAGVEVRVLYDWMGCWATPRRYWRPFHKAGVEVRAYNPPSFGDPFGLLQRDHRKLVCVDGEVAFIGGFCVGQEWAGSELEPPWRDTGVEMRGPAAAVAAGAFEQIWALMGEPVPERLMRDPALVPHVGDTPVWLIEGVPWRTRVYRAVQLIAATARERIWITDPYFVTPRPVAEGLMAAARDGVDVRVLVPAHNNWPWVGSLVRSGYRTLLESGVRIFEWQGPMIHAKTAVADGIWCRVGSSNLNAASLLGNWEIDAGILDADLARALEALFLADLASAVEIVLPRRREPTTHHPSAERALQPRTSTLEPLDFQDRLDRWRRSGPGQAGTGLASLVRAGSATLDAIAGRRTLDRENRTVLMTTAAALVVLAILAALAPHIAGWVVAALLGWVGVTTGLRALLQARRARREILEDVRE
ncbi:MAG: phospholipase D-like domain-containing protein [Gemmatimonadota bacterium]|nr:cardiolipin synthase B [Gemmatimonadota bacterium]